ncbi:MAG: ubiquinone-binding protein [Rhodospirillaceae bacterium]|jgi:coenzyme Q-binding protein COQ10|nr:ubiquinone-binding protein [Rhodospirillaceae bacterium]|tara:strand:+ start:431 stop:865 length:435 start_codon:yes stop_codon:yes gene_type:complete
MPTHAEKRHLPYSDRQMFDLVANIECYPEFLPWCVGTRIKTRDEEMIVADMVIGYKMFREKFTSRVKLSTPDRIDVIYEDGPFRYLNNHWIFLPQEDGSCVVDFYVDFEFRSKLLQKMIGVVFNEAVKIMVHAFEKRATAVYAE